MKININGSLAASAAFSIGYYYDKVSNADSALKYYQFVVDNYPESDQSKFASQRLSSINQALALIKLDSTSSSASIRLTYPFPGPFIKS